MASLPPIPEEAHDAASEAFWDAGVGTNPLRDAIEAAYPHIAEAVLHWATDRLFYEFGSEELVNAWAILDRWADEIKGLSVIDTEGRWKIACINWGHDDAPHALVYLLVNGEMRGARYFPAWADAIKAAFKEAQRD